MAVRDEANPTDLLLHLWLIPCADIAVPVQKPDHNAVCSRQLYAELHQHNRASRAFHPHVDAFDNWRRAVVRGRRRSR